MTGNILSLLYSSLLVWLNFNKGILHVRSQIPHIIYRLHHHASDINKNTVCLSELHSLHATVCMCLSAAASGVTVDTPILTASSCVTCDRRRSLLSSLCILRRHPVIWLRWHMLCGLRDANTNEKNLWVQLLVGCKHRECACTGTEWRRCTEEVGTARCLDERWYEDFIKRKQYVLPIRRLQDRLSEYILALADLDLSNMAADV